MEVWSFSSALITNFCLLLRAYWVWHVPNELIVSTLHSSPGIFVPNFSLYYNCWSSTGISYKVKISVHKHDNPSFWCPWWIETVQCITLLSQKDTSISHDFVYNFEYSVGCWSLSYWWKIELQNPEAAEQYHYGAVLGIISFAWEAGLISPCTMLL